MRACVIACCLLLVACCLCLFLSLSLTHTLSQTHRHTQTQTHALTPTPTKTLHLHLSVLVALRCAKWSDLSCLQFVLELKHSLHLPLVDFAGALELRSSDGGCNAQKNADTNRHTFIRVHRVEAHERGKRMTARARVCACV